MKRFWLCENRKARKEGRKEKKIRSRRHNFYRRMEKQNLIFVVTFNLKEKENLPLSQNSTKISHGILSTIFFNIFVINDFNYSKAK